MSSPRVVTWKPWEHWLLRGAALLLLVGAALLTIWGVSELRKDSRLDDVGVEVPADVVRADVDDSGESTVTALTVRFTQRGDARTVTTAEISYDGDFPADRPRAVRDGVRIEYDPEDPQLVRLVGDDDDRGIELLVGAGLCLVLGLATTAFAVWGQRHRAT
jgi:hypothetical protein